MSYIYTHLTLPMIHPFFLAFLALALTGCTHFYPACPGDSCQAQQYIKDKYTCADISADHSRHLNACGYDTRVIVGSVQGLPVPHAWVEVQNEGRAYWMDPTWQFGCFPASRWTDRVAEWKYERGVTGLEVKTYQKKEKYRHE